MLLLRPLQNTSSGGRQTTYRVGPLVTVRRTYLCKQYDAFFFPAQSVTLSLNQMSSPQVQLHSLAACLVTSL